MLASEELILLIKSRYPVIFVESIDEPYVVNQLRQVASQINLSFYQWSVTTGLQKGSKEEGFYQTGEPEKMIRTVLSSGSGPLFLGSLISFSYGVPFY